jgi:hypothetical protein
MITMLEVFFKDIPSIVFEPIAVFGWAGLLTALYLYRKERSTLYLTVIFSLAFMILWRCAIQIVSSRYAEILIFPMTVAAAFFIFQLENIRKIFPALPEKYIKYLPLCLVAILTVICIIKNLNYNSYTPIMDAVQVVKEDKSTGKLVIYAMEKDRARQIEYYSGEKVCVLKPFPEDYSNKLTPELCRKIIAEATAKKSAETVYIFVTTSAQSPIVTAGELGLKDASWQLITEQYFNGKKKKALRVYKYISESRL